jgi:hypothetical protein
MAKGKVCWLANDWLYSLLANFIHTPNDREQRLRNGAPGKEELKEREQDQRAANVNRRGDSGHKDKRYGNHRNENAQTKKKGLVMEHERRDGRERFVSEHIAENLIERMDAECKIHVWVGNPKHNCGTGKPHRAGDGSNFRCVSVRYVAHRVERARFTSTAQ